MEMINSLVAKLQNVLSDLPGQASKPTVEVHAEAACEETAVQGAAVVRHVASPDCNSCGVVYDAVMELHLREGHAEHPNRIRELNSKLEREGLLSRCQRLTPKLASTEELLKCHSQAHIDKVDQLYSRPINTKGGPAEREGDTFIISGDIYCNQYTSTAARSAAGCSIQAVRAVLCGEVCSAFAVVRPPGHHAESEELMGFCFFNNVAVAAHAALDQPGIERVLILDWDIHHGNGTQQIFQQDPRVLFVSLHRRDPTFYPMGCGFASEVGSGPGLGFNVNVPWGSRGMGDADYLAAFDLVLEPIITQFDPQLVLVSAGFDAADGDFLGQCHVSPAGFAAMTQRLRQHAGGRLVAVLEGGYVPSIVGDCAAAVMRVLQGAEPPPLPKPSGYTTHKTLRAVLNKVDSVQRQYWSGLAALPPFAERYKQYSNTVNFERLNLKSPLDGQAAVVAATAHHATRASTRASAAAAAAGEQVDAAPPAQVLAAEPGAVKRAAAEKRAAATAARRAAAAATRASPGGVVEPAASAVVGVAAPAAAPVATNAASIRLESAAITPDRLADSPLGSNGPPAAAVPEAAAAAALADLLGGLSIARQPPSSSAAVASAAAAVAAAAAPGEASTCVEAAGVLPLVTVQDAAANTPLPASGNAPHAAPTSCSYHHQQQQQQAAAPTLEARLVSGAGAEGAPSSPQPTVTNPPGWPLNVTPQAAATQQSTMGTPRQSAAVGTPPAAAPGGGAAGLAAAGSSEQASLSSRSPGSAAWQNSSMGHGMVAAATPPVARVPARGFEGEQLAAAIEPAAIAGCHAASLPLQRVAVRPPPSTPLAVIQTKSEAASGQPTPAAMNAAAVPYQPLVQPPLAVALPGSCPAPTAAAATTSTTTTAPAVADSAAVLQPWQPDGSAAWQSMATPPRASSMGPAAATRGLAVGGPEVPPAAASGGNYTSSITSANSSSSGGGAAAVVAQQPALEPPNAVNVPSSYQSCYALHASAAAAGAGGADGHLAAMPAVQDAALAHVAEPAAVLQGGAAAAAPAAVPECGAAAVTATGAASCGTEEVLAGDVQQSARLCDLRAAAAMPLPDDDI